jgi:hypothetical protein
MKARIGRSAGHGLARNRLRPRDRVEFVSSVTFATEQDLRAICAKPTNHFLYYSLHLSLSIFHHSEYSRRISLDLDGKPS